MLERDIEQALSNEVRKYGGLALKLSIIFGAGFPDRTCMFPGGRIVFIETKSAKGTLRGGQIYWLRKLQSLGFSAGVVRSVEAAAAVIEAFAKNEELPASFCRTPVV